MSEDTTENSNTLQQNINNNNCSSSSSSSSGSSSSNNSSKDNEMAIPLQIEAPSVILFLRVHFSYLGSMQMPSTWKQDPSVTCISTCIKRVQNEDREPIPVIFEVIDLGFRLLNDSGKIIRTFPFNEIAYGGVYQQNANYLAIVTKSFLEGEIDSAKQNEGPLNICHAFLVEDPTALLKYHGPAKQLRISRNLSIIDNPKNASKVLRAIIRTVELCFKEGSQTGMPKSRYDDNTGIPILVDFRPSSSQYSAETLKPERRQSIDSSDGSMTDTATLTITARSTSIYHNLTVNNGSEMDSNPKDHESPTLIKDNILDTDIQTPTVRSECDLHSTSTVKPVNGQFRSKSKLSAPEFKLIRSPSLDCIPKQALLEPEIIGEETNITQRENTLFERRTHARHSLNSKSKKNNQKSQSNRVAGWIESLPKLLNDELGIEVFHEFLCTQFSQENLDFWLECQKFKQNENQAQLISNSISIYDTFLCDGAPQQINIDDRTRQEITRCLQNPHLSIFTSAQNHIFQILNYDCFPRFRRSQMLNDYMKAELQGLPWPNRTNNNSNNSEISRNINPKQSKQGSSSGLFRRKLKKRNSFGSVNDSSNKNESIKKNNTGGSSHSGKQILSSLFGWNRGLARSKREGFEDTKSTGSNESIEFVFKDSNDFVPQLDTTSCVVTLHLPGGSSKFISLSQKLSLKQILMPTFDQFQLDFNVNVIRDAATVQPVDIELPSFEFKDRQLMVQEHSETFSLQLPETSTFGAQSFLLRAIENKTLYDVIRPILISRSINTENITAHLSDCQVPLQLDIPCSSLVKQTICIKENEISTIKTKSSKISLFDSILHSPKKVRSLGPTPVPFQDVSYSGTGITVPAVIDKKHEKTGKTHYPDRKISTTNILNSFKKSSDVKDLQLKVPTSDLVDKISRAQGNRLDDQRCLPIGHMTSEFENRAQNQVMTSLIKSNQEKLICPHTGECISFSEQTFARDSENSANNPNDRNQSFNVALRLGQLKPQKVLHQNSKSNNDNESLLKSKQFHKSAHIPDHTHIPSQDLNAFDLNKPIPFHRSLSPKPRLQHQQVQNIPYKELNSLDHTDRLNMTLSDCSVKTFSNSSPALLKQMPLIQSNLPAQNSSLANVHSNQPRNIQQPNLKYINNNNNNNDNNNNNNLFNQHNYPPYYNHHNSHSQNKNPRGTISSISTNPSPFDELNLPGRIQFVNHNKFLDSDHIDSSSDYNSQDRRQIQDLELTQQRNFSVNNNSQSSTSSNSPCDHPRSVRSMQSAFFQPPKSLDEIKIVTEPITKFNYYNISSPNDQIRAPLSKKPPPIPQRININSSFTHSLNMPPTENNTHYDPDNIQHFEYPVFNTHSISKTNRGAPPPPLPAKNIKLNLAIKDSKPQQKYTIL